MEKYKKKNDERNKAIILYNIFEKIQIYQQRAYELKKCDRRKTTTAPHNKTIN
ncbi:MAG: hypothetical protein AAF573_12540 [Bacteroidota bacterium]